MDYPSDAVKAAATAANLKARSDSHITWLTDGKRQRKGSATGISAKQTSWRTKSCTAMTAGTSD